MMVKTKQMKIVGRDFADGKWNWKRILNGTNKVKDKDKEKEDEKDEPKEVKENKEKKKKKKRNRRRRRKRSHMDCINTVSKYHKEN